MERVPLHDREMEISIQYHVMLIRQSNNQILMRCYIISVSSPWMKRKPDAGKNPRIAAVVHGCQHDGKTWVMNQFCQIYYDGDQMVIESP